MKVALVSALATGGAAMACRRLHLGLLGEGVESCLLLPKGRAVQLPATFFEGPKRAPYTRLTMKVDQALGLISLGRTARRRHYRKSRPDQLDAFSFEDSPYDLTKSKPIVEAEVVNLHWVSGFVDHVTFFRVNKKPVVWTLHDQNPFSGGEHYELSDAATNYGLQFAGYRPKDQAVEARLRRRKVKTLRAVNSSIHIVSPSKWLADLSQKSDALGRFPHHVIPNSVDGAIFRPWSQRFCQELFGLPTDGRVVLFVAHSLYSFRKGYFLLEQAINLIAGNLPGVRFCAIGGSRGLGTGSIDLLGPVNDERLMALAYAAADLFVLPSLMDNLPNTMLESLMCGTPVVGFKIGGIPDVVVHGQNGYLCDDVSPASLAAGIVQVLDHGVGWSRDEISRRAKERYDLPVQARAYQELFERLLRR